jgi:Leucine-rich repeat (LRR) protein
MDKTVLKDVTFEERHMQNVLNKINSTSTARLDKNNNFFSNGIRATFASLAVIVLVFVVIYNSEINIGEKDPQPNKEQSPVDTPDDKKSDDPSDDEKENEHLNEDKEVKEATEDKVVLIENKVLEEAIRKRLQKEQGDLTEADMLKLDSLSLNNVSGNLNGIEHAKNLNYLYISTNNNESIDLAQLSGLPNLWQVFIRGSGKYENLSALSECESLTELHLRGWVDLEQVASLKNITKLQVELEDGTELRDLTPLANLSNLGSLKLINTNFENFAPLSNLTNLYELGLYYTFDRADPSKEVLINFSTIENLKNLKRLTINNYGIKDISSLANLNKLEGLTLKQNNISDISPLSDLKNLSGLSLQENNISNISSLAQLNNMWHLTLSYNNINNISAIANLTELKTLYLDGNNISELEPISNLTNLFMLYINDTNVSNIKALENLTSISRLEIKGSPFNDIKSLENQLLNFPSLSELMISEELKEKFIDTGTFETLQNRNIRIYTEPEQSNMKEWQDV